jgi:hypothetical protein
MCAISRRLSFISTVLIYESLFPEPAWKWIERPLCMTCLPIRKTWSEIR